MSDYSTIVLDARHELVWFEDLREWHARWHNGKIEQYSLQGWDTKIEGIRAFEQGGLSWTASVPGHGAA